MTELDKILLTSGLTIVGGCLVFVFQRFLLDPLNEQSRVLGRITFALHYYGREYNSPLHLEHADQASQHRYWAVTDKLRELGSSLAETSQGIRLYWIWTILRMAPGRKRIDEAIGLLTGMSNSMFASTAQDRADQGRQNGDDANAITALLRLRRWGK